MLTEQENTGRDDSGAQKMTNRQARQDDRTEQENTGQDDSGAGKMTG